MRQSAEVTGAGDTPNLVQVWKKGDGRRTKGIRDRKAPNESQWRKGGALQLFGSMLLCSPWRKWGRWWLQWPPSSFGVEDQVITDIVGAWVWNLLPPLWTLPFNSPLPDSSVGKESTCNAGDPGSIPGLGKFTGEGIGYPLQYSGLENSMDCIVHGVTKSQAWLTFPFFHSVLIRL